MDYDEITSLQRHDPSWRLLRAENAPLILEFLGRVFVEENIRSISATELVGRLDDQLYGLRERLGNVRGSSRCERARLSAPNHG